MTTMKTDTPTPGLLERTIESLRKSPSTAARRGIIAELEREDAVKRLLANTQEPIREVVLAAPDAPVVFKCIGCQCDVPVQSVTCPACVLKNPPTITVAPMPDHKCPGCEYCSLSKDWDPIGDVQAFHEKFDIAYVGPPRLLPDVRGIEEDIQERLQMKHSPPGIGMAEFRRRFLKEEAAEYAAATYRGNYHLHLTADVDGKTTQVTKCLADALDALVDELYVLLGNAHLHGFTRARFVEAWNRVHAKNMQKVRALADGSDSKRGTPLDVVKPEGWVAADLSDLVDDHIHQPPLEDDDGFREGDQLCEPDLRGEHDVELGDIAEPGK